MLKRSLLFSASLVHPNKKEVKSKVKKFRLPLVLIGILCFMCQSAYACTDAVFRLEWADSIDTSNFEVHSFAYSFEDDIKNSIYSWNGITSQIGIDSVNYWDEDSGIDGEDIFSTGIIFYEHCLTGSLLGKAFFYENGPWGCDEVGTSSKEINLCKILLNTNMLNSSAKLREKVVIHELGHAFGLCHPIEVDCTAYAVMQQTSTDYYALTIQRHDENNLIEKWGE